MFQINGKWWKISYVDPTSRELRRSDGSFTPGICDISIQTIFICDTLQGGFLKKVMTHEICHAAMASYGVILDIETEELVCDIMASYGQEIIDIVNDMFRALRSVA